jgi:iron complex outermembrane receptor protein
MNPSSTLTSAWLSIALALSAPVSASEKAMAFNIPAQALSDALLEFSQNSGLKVFFSSNDARNLLSPGLKGHYTATQGLQKLLAGTHLQAQNSSDGVITLTKQTVSETATSQQPITSLPTVTVIGQTVYDDFAEDSPDNPTYNKIQASTATKTDTPLMETPYSVKAIPQQIIKDQQAVRLEKILQNVSGVTREPAGNLAYESFNVRGFQSWLIYRDGLRLNDLSSPRETANLERVEVLKGPGSILFGRSDPGGIINQVTKQPLATPYYALQQQFGSFDYYRTTLDTTGPINGNENVLYRFNMAYEDSASFKPFKDSDHIFLAPVLKWQITPSTQVGLELEYLDNSMRPDVGIPAINGRPANVPRERNLTQPWSKFDNNYALVGLNWSHAFNENWTIRHRFNTQQSSADMMNIGRDSTDPDGTDYLWYGGQIQNMETYFTTVDLTGKFSTAGIGHTLLMGGDYFRLNDHGQYIDPINAAGDYDLLKIDIYNPTYLSKPPTNVVWETSDWSNTTDWYGLFIQDQIKLPFDLHGLAGIRYDNATTTDNLAHSSYDEDKLSTRGGLVWRPVKEWSLYGSYTENFGLNNGVYNADNKPLPSQTAEQWEVGMKTELLDGRFTGSLAWFELTKQNLPALDPDYNGPGQRYVAIGEVQSRGLELDIAGELLPGWRLMGAYTYMPDATVIKDYNRSDQGEVNNGNLGRRNPNAPINSGSLWTTYEWQAGQLRGLNVGAGVVAVGERQGRLNNDYQMPGYATLNLLARYGLNFGHAKTSLQLNIDNITDENYFSGSNGGSNIHFGAPRTFMGSVRVEY